MKIYNKIYVIDNFLSSNDFHKLKTSLLESRQWKFNSGTILESNSDLNLWDTQFTIMIYNNSMFFYNTPELFNPIIDKLQMMSILKIKSNISLYSGHNHTTNIFHDDLGLNSNKFSHPHYTSILYINNCNGYTEFKNGIKVHSKENRMLIFDGSYNHKAVKSYDSSYRCVINFNYICNFTINYDKYLESI